MVKNILKYIIIHFTYNQCQRRSCYTPRNPQIRASRVAFGFQDWNCVFPEDGTHVTKHNVQFHLMFVPIMNVHLVGITNDLR